MIIEFLLFFNIFFIYGQKIDFECVNPYVTLHIYSSKLNPRWKINQTDVKLIHNFRKKVSERNSSMRIMGYQGFSLSCDDKNDIFIHQSIEIEKQLLQTGRSVLSKEILNHVQSYLGQSNGISNNYLRNIPKINCNHVPIKGPDTVPIYNPLTDNGGCFITKQSNNNCYAYGVDIVTNSYPQPGRYSGRNPSSISCQSIRNASIRDGLVYKGINFPNDQPKLGHYLALFIWPNVDYHWIRKDQNGYWSHKPGTGRVTNRDNTGSLISNPVKSNLSPWVLFCGYFTAQPSKVHIY